MIKTATERVKPQDCICGECFIGKDDHGNLDYGYRWSEKRSDYIVRSCPVAQMAAERGASVNGLFISGHLR